MNGVTAAEKAAVLAHYTAQAAQAISTAQRTKHHDWAMVTFEGGEMDARYVIDEDGINIKAVCLNGAWVQPEDLFLPSLIECWEAEIAAALDEDDDHERTLNSMRGPL